MLSTLSAAASAVDWGLVSRALLNVAAAVASVVF